MSHPIQRKQHSSFEHLPDSALIRINQLVGVVLPFSAATLWRKCRRGEFPPPIRVSAGVTAWQVGAVRTWLKDPGQFALRDPQTGQRPHSQKRPLRSGRINNHVLPDTSCGGQHGNASVTTPRQADKGAL